MYGKYSTRVQVEWQIQHEVNLSAVFDRTPHPEYSIFCTSQVNSVLTDLLFCIGGLAVAVAVAMNPKHDV